MQIPIWDQFVHLLETGLLLVNSWTGNLALAIILFTLFLMALFTPLMLPSLRNSRKQQELAPQIRQIQKKHGKDKAAAQKEVMELYSQYGFNPLSGCLPMLVQWPFFLGFWRALMNLSKTDVAQHSHFLWISNISNHDTWHILPILAFVAQFVQTRMMMPRKADQDPQQASMNFMMQFMPLMVVVIGWNMSAGAVLYWVVSSIYRAVLQFFITGWGSLVELPVIGPALPRRQPRSYLKPPDPNKPRKQGFMARMQQKMLEAQEQQRSAQSRGGSPAVAEGGAGKATRDEAPERPEVSLEEAEQQGVRFTDDAWRLPGAPGTNATIGTLAQTTAGASNGSAPAAQNRPQSSKRQGSRKRKRR